MTDAIANENFSAAIPEVRVSAAVGQLLAQNSTIPENDIRVGVSVSSSGEGIISPAGALPLTQEVKFSIRLPESIKNSPQKADQIIRQALGDVPFFANNLNGLKPAESQPSFAAVLKSNLLVLPAPAADQAQGLLAEERAQLEKWANNSTTEWRSITAGKDAPIAVSWDFTNWNQEGAAKEAAENSAALDARASLTPRLEAIRAELFQQGEASPLLTAEDKAQLQNLKVQLAPLDPAKPHEVKLEIGLDSGKKDASGQPILESSPLIKLQSEMTKDQQTLLDATVVHAVTFAGDFMPSLHMAKEAEIKSYLEGRAQTITEPEQKTAVEALLKNAAIGDQMSVNLSNPSTDSYNKHADFQLTISGVKDPQAVFASIIEQARTHEKDPTASFVARVVKRGPTESQVEALAAQTANTNTGDGIPRSA